MPPGRTAVRKVARFMRVDAAGAGAVSPRPMPGIQRVTRADAAGAGLLVICHVKGQSYDDQADDDGGNSVDVHFQVTGLVNAA